ncbi:hypothetical protein GCM10010218_49330 [Streptomyces mashuensis]|uniref:SapB/AmfS family lantipeptide n=1 Tax=Streptomyces mashuensis TaxID=33904 RepID=A0A919B7T5_9ACTN|nr:SapB/AmfS family lanthipeptide [Streptomyces mashuensis]GHF61863.1 hypothetical protein GCM10010218_49330 [Streptomyces mashuensis]
MTLLDLQVMELDDGTAASGGDASVLEPTSDLSILICHEFSAAG